MPKRKADSWPESILNDPDVLSLDDEGRFVLCKVCHVYYAVHGGKKPKPIIMNSSFRTRAWEVHKERTNSHRPQKRAMLDTDEDMKEEQKDEEEDDQEVSVRSGAGGDGGVDEGAAEHAPQCPLHSSNLPSVEGAPVRTIEVAEPRSPRARVSRDGAQGTTRSWSSLPPRRHSSHERPVRQHEPMQRATTASHTPLTTDQEMDRFRRWRRMDEDVSRALGSMRMQAAGEAFVPEPTPSASVQLSETEDFSGNNERVARKLKSLDEEYDARVLKHSDELGQQRDEMYRRYWGTMRDVYNPANAGTATTTPSTAANKKKAAHSSTNRTSDATCTKESAQAESTTHADSTTPDESGSSDDLSKPVVVHDQGLINAINRLTGIITRQNTEPITTESALIVQSLANLTQAVEQLQASQDAAFARLITLQEQKLEMMQTLLVQHTRHDPPQSAAASEADMTDG